ncbi:MAG TPA: isochorismatase family protein [Azospirillaceae bacterium]|nr:isochorismatase family protein [Azospirillaceae bacterium]HRQ81732.1 isochorismatase family protein [Azospirillaceae bacterium]
MTASIADSLPIALQAYPLTGKRAGLVIIDEVNGFCTPGCGPLAPPAPDAVVEQMVAETDALAGRFLAGGLPVLVSLDSHDPAKPEPPYPPHCLQGTGDDQLVPALQWLETAPGVTLLAKDCINFYIGGVRADGGNGVSDWIVGHKLETVVVVGICTDICVMDFVLTLLSARNHGLTGDLRDVVVYEPACATYDLPLEVARKLGLPDTAAHPRAQTHHAGLYFMASRGALLAGRLD